MKFFDIINLLNEQEGANVPAPQPAVPPQTAPQPPPAPVEKGPEKILIDGYEKTRQITIDCLTILKNCIDLGLNMEGVITPKLQELIKPMEIPDVVSNEKIAQTIQTIHDGVTKNIKNESPEESL